MASAFGIGSTALTVWMLASFRMVTSGVVIPKSTRGPGLWFA